VGFLQNLSAALKRISGRGQQTAGPTPPPGDTTQEVEEVNTQQPPDVPTDDQINYIGSSDCDLEYISYADGKRINKWRVGREGGDVLMADCFRDLINAVPDWNAFSVAVHGEQFQLYPQKETATYWLSYRMSAIAVYDTMNDDEYQSAADIVNALVGVDDQWQYVDSIAILDRIPDDY
jgi:hypothetical protein